VRLWLQKTLSALSRVQFFLTCVPTEQASLRPIGNLRPYHFALKYQERRRVGQRRSVRHRPAAQIFNRRLRWDDRDDFQCNRIDDQNAVADQDVIEAAILRYDTHDVFGEYRNVNISRNSRADSDVEVLPLKPRRDSLPITA
jgi:hypothetical protein